MSRRWSKRVANSFDVDIVHKVVADMLHTESEEKNRQMKDQDAKSPFTRSEQSFVWARASRK